MNDLLRPTVVAAAAATVLLLGCTSAFASFDATASADQAPPAATEAEVTLTRPTDAELSPTRVELLELAIGAAEALPAKPHLKTQARMQARVVETCFELGAPNRAIGYANRITNWRRGVAYADFAYYAADAGHLKDVPACIEYARTVAGTAADWRKDRINVKIARALALLGEREKAAALQATVGESERGKVDTALVRQLETLDDDAFAAVLKSADESAAFANFDMARNAIATLAEVYGKEYRNAERRTAIEEATRRVWTTGKLPIQLRIEALQALADHALVHQDHERVRVLMDEARSIFDNYKWTAEYGVPMIASIARRRGQAADAARATSELNEALALYHSEIETIGGIFRADALRPVAEAFAAMGEQERALEVYALTLEAGAANPNGRPRAEDLVLTLCSFVRTDLEPTDALRARMVEIREGLVSPW